MDHEQIGKYRIVGELGRGTMGEVYKAHDPVLNRYVALKTIAAQGGAADSLQRFQREAQAAALLNHPNIVTVHDFGQEHGLLYMAMELLDGSDLRQALDSGAVMSLDEKLAIVDGVLAALEYAHDRGVVHRDIKPANVRLGVGGQVKLVDFGLARVNSSEMTQEGIVLGTPNYMSPEQAQGERVDGRSDLFSTGAVLYELVTGHRPFEAETTPSVLFQVVHKDPPPVRQWAPGTPAVVAEFVERALVKDRERRFATAQEMRAALARVRAALAADASAARLARAGESSGARRPAASRPAAAPRPSGSGALRGGATTRGTGPLTARRPLPAPARSGAARVRPRRAPWPWLAAAAVVLVLAGAGTWAWLASRGDAADETDVNALTRALVTAQVQLANRELEGKNYAAAIQQAEGVLRLSPRHPEAQKVLAESRRRQKELERAAAAARQQLARGDNAAAGRQLWRVLELDPRHPAAAELATRLNATFNPTPAESAMRAAETAANEAGAAGSAEYERAAEQARGARAALARGRAADAARSFLEARDGFERARAARDR